MNQRLFVAAVLVLTLAACGGAPTPPPHGVSEAASPSIPPPPTQGARLTSGSAPDAIVGKLDQGSYQLVMTCYGAGSPTVVLDGSVDGAMGTWARVQREVKTFTRVCAYSRLGNPQPPLTSQQIAQPRCGRQDRLGTGRS